MNPFKTLNKKAKSTLHYFFIETRAGIYIMTSLAFLNTIEGIVHLIVSGVGSWGLIDTSTYDWRTWIPVIENFIFGAFSILTGWALGVKHEHHHH